MKHRKLYMLLGILLIVGCLVAAIGISFARYRDHWKGNMGFQAEKVGRLHLGTVTNDTFSAKQAAWEQTESGWQMLFAVGNGISENDHAQIDQRVTLQMVASLGAWSDQSAGAIALKVGKTTYTATASRIPTGSALHTKFGDGWVFQFVDTEGNAYIGELSGSAFEFIPMELTINSTPIMDTSLLQLQVTAEIS